MRGNSNSVLMLKLIPGIEFNTRIAWRLNRALDSGKSCMLRICLHDFPWALCSHQRATFYLGSAKWWTQNENDVSCIKLPSILFLFKSVMTSTKHLKTAHNKKKTLKLSHAINWSNLKPKLSPDGLKTYCRL